MTAPHKINPLVAVGVPTFGRVSTLWARNSNVGGPLGSNTIRFEVLGKPVAEARNELMATAIGAGADFLFMLGDDVIPPSDVINRLLHRLWDNPELHLVTGVYWSKQWPTAPYLWRDLQKGPYLDWRCGEYFQIDFAGCDCLLIRLSPEVKALGPDWFSTEWLWTDEQERPDATMATEDFYFYAKARKAGLELWCDTSVQCLHEDRNSGHCYGLLSEMPQAGGIVPTLPEGVPTIADLGCGLDSPYFGEPGTVNVVKIDGNEKLQPDVRCDLRTIPVPDESFDIVHARHVLEHFGRGELLSTIREWVRILKVGGELRIGVPNLLWAIDRIQQMESGAIPPEPVPWWVLYGRQDDHYDYHKNAFTPRRLQLLLEGLGTLGDVEVRELDDGFNLAATATKTRHERPMALATEWTEIQERLAATNGHAPIAEGEAAMGLASPSPVVLTWGPLPADGPIPTRESVAVAKPRRSHKKKTPEPAEAVKEAL